MVQKSGARWHRLAHYATTAGEQSTSSGRGSRSVGSALGGAGSRAAGAAASQAATETLDQTALSTNEVSCDLPTAPTWVECTAPSLNIIRVGMPRTAYWRGTFGLLSMLILTTLTLPA